VRWRGLIGETTTGQKSRRFLHEEKIDTLPTAGTGARRSSRPACFFRAETPKLCRLDRESQPTTSSFSGVRPRRCRKGNHALRRRDFPNYAKAFSATRSSRVTKLCALREEKTFIALDPKPKRQLAFTALDLITTTSASRSLCSPASSPWAARRLSRRRRLRAAALNSTERSTSVITSAKRRHDSSATAANF